MRFRKSIQIFKGLKLNFSKSGVTATIGGKGISANVGAKGVFLNTSIPGTGLYDRKKVLDFSGDKKSQGASKAKSTPSGALKGVPDEAALEAELEAYNALTDAFVHIGALSETLPADYSPRQLATAPDGDEVEEKIGKWLGSLNLPIDFHASYEYEDGVLMVDLDLPEIEHLPTRKLVRLSSGQLKEKDKSQKELREEYAQCVFGLGMFCASHFFAVTPRMERVLLSAYTQRRDTRTGDLIDVYIYSVVFEREAFEKRGYQDQEPEQFLCRFKNRMNKASTGELKGIVPYTAEDL
ncbi:MAG: DUF4236 domain-containing protein [Clostridia bacterium]|nr:DUF4236 domain-containing protein [Clostridia bacterium]